LQSGGYAKLLSSQRLPHFGLPEDGQQKKLVVRFQRAEHFSRVR
jgi:hypothetical protein